MDNFHERIVTAVQLREQGKLNEASAAFRNILADAKAKQNWNVVVDAELQRVICYEHMYYASSSKAWLNLIADITQAVIRICHNQHLSNLMPIAYMRLGDSHLLAGEFEKALQQYNKVISLVPSTPTAQLIEFRKKQLLATGLSGRLNTTKEICKLINELEATTEYVQGMILEESHRLTIRCGLNLAAGKVALKFNQRTRAENFLEAAWRDAEVLEHRYKHVLRKWEVARLADQITTPA